MHEGQDRISNGELQRLFERMERGLVEFRIENQREIRHLSIDIQLALKELAKIVTRVEASEFDISELHTEAKGVHSDIRILESKINDTIKNAAFMSGGIAALAYLVKLWPFGK